MLSQQPSIYGIAVADSHERVGAGIARSEVAIETARRGSKDQGGMSEGRLRLRERLGHLAARLALGGA